jgi:dTDP-4-dehydrorhamnose reductase
LKKKKETAVIIVGYFNERVCSWHDFANAIIDIKGISIRVNPIESSQYPTLATRPHYSGLNVYETQLRT